MHSLRCLLRKGLISILLNKFAILYNLLFIQTFHTALSDTVVSMSDCKAKGNHVTHTHCAKVLCTCKEML